MDQGMPLTLEQRLAALEGMFLQAQAENQVLRNQLAEAQARVAPPPPPEPEPEDLPARKRSALPDPTPFKGDRSKFHSFMEQNQLHFTEDPVYFKRDQNKISFILALMTDGLATSFRSQWMMEKEAVIYQPGQERGYEKYSYFLNRLRTLFVDTAEVQRSRAALA